MQSPASISQPRRPSIAYRPRLELDILVLVLAGQAWCLQVDQMEDAATPKAGQIAQRRLCVQFGQLIAEQINSMAELMKFLLDRNQGIGPA